jgi:predicted RND superfamily exporter protein
VLAGHPRLAVVHGVLCLILVGTVLAFVDLSPRVERDFFFVSDDPAVAEDERISQTFAGAGGSHVVLVIGGDLRSDAYYAGVDALTRDLADVSGVDEVNSITAGPKTPRDGFESPFWQRLVGSERADATRILVTLEESAARETIAAIERVAAEHEAPGLHIHTSGVPFVIEQIRRSLLRDMIVFSSAAILVFGVLVVLLFRSVAVLLGTMVSSLSACAVTLVATQLLGQRIGVLTANVVTIVFIMTLHHVIYMTYAWKGAGCRVEEAVRESIAASAWVMLTTLLGFGSLVLVAAEPLRQLGIAGAIGAVIAFVVAYLVHPSFLRLAGGATRPVPARETPRAVPRLLARPHGAIVVAFVATAALLATGIPRLNRDPSLRTYFAAESPIREGLTQVDRSGGSSPLRIVLRDRAGAKLEDKRAYRRLWRLHEELERHPAVGTVVSLPLIMAEAKDAPLGFLLPHRKLLERMEKPKYGGITHVFVTEDRERALFVLRMHEADERQERLRTVEELERIVRAHDFEVEMVGGLYYLHGKLSDVVVSSLITGVGQLLLGFLVVSALVARSVRWSVALVATLALVPAIVLGLVGWLAVPLDIISAPAINIALGMAIDDMLHLTDRARRLRREGADPWSAWVRARATQWKPLLGTMATVCCGFAIFLLSSFPPTQRFGAAVVLGSLLDVVACLFVLPLLAGFPLGMLRTGAARSRLLASLRGAAQSSRTVSGGEPPSISQR